MKWMSGSAMQRGGATGPQVTAAGVALLGRVLPASHSAAFSVEHVPPDPITGHD
jgi:hypothetical protein